jgi:hypothetical protein
VNSLPNKKGFCNKKRSKIENNFIKNEKTAQQSQKNRQKKLAQRFKNT